MSVSGTRVLNINGRADVGSQEYQINTAVCTCDRYESKSGYGAIKEKFREQELDLAEVEDEI